MELSGYKIFEQDGDIYRSLFYHRELELKIGKSYEAKERCWYSDDDVWGFFLFAERQKARDYLDHLWEAYPQEGIFPYVIKNYRWKSLVLLRVNYWDTHIQPHKIPQHSMNGFTVARFITLRRLDD